MTSKEKLERWIAEGASNGSRGRIRTYRFSPEHQGLTKANALPDALEVAPDALLSELIGRWPELSNEIKRAVLAAVRACGGDRPEKGN